jgi:hypothetical protein
MKTIPLSQGKVAVVDDSDYPNLSKFKWSFSPCTALRRISRTNKMIKMHIQIMGKKKGCVIDHIDGDPLNNQRANLRFCFQRENTCNRRKSRNNKSGFKGVVFIGKTPRKNPWKAEITKNGKTKHIGVYLTAEDAAKAYDETAKKLHGAFAKLNFTAGI